MSETTRVIVGHVKWWSEAKKYGFIATDEGDALISKGVLQTAGLPTLAMGLQCETLK
jgi:cold shock CspA family protein